MCFERGASIGGDQSRALGDKVGTVFRASAFYLPGIEDNIGGCLMN